MEEYKFLLDLALILLATKFLGLFTKRFALPQVVGALFAGLLLGPAFLGILTETEFITNISKLGVIVLMFSAGMETNVSQLKHAGKASCVIALLGVLLPLAGGFAVAYFFGGENMLENVFIGIILTATSVSITVETLRELGTLNTKAGNAILGAALIDDVLGIIGLTIVTGMAGGGDSVIVVCLKILAFFALCLVLGILLHKMFMRWFSHYASDRRRFVVVAFAFCLLLSFVAEAVFGVADITGAYVAGLIFAQTRETNYLHNRFNSLSYMLLSPVFFASIGLQVVVTSFSGTLVAFTLVMLVVAVLSKIVGCGVGAKLCCYTTAESFQIGSGMVSRGEVALIVAAKGLALGLLSTELFAPIVIVVIATTIVAPILLKIAFKPKKEEAVQA